METIIVIVTFISDNRFWIMPLLVAGAVCGLVEVVADLYGAPSKDIREYLQQRKAGEKID